MFPEAGGSSSFARHAFNELVSFFAGWALSLDYILTIAISAFFVPHYLSTFPGLAGLNHNPGDIFGGLIVIVALAGLNIRGLGESAKLNFILAIVDLSTQVLLVGVGAVLVLDPSLLIHQVHLGKVPSWHELIFALSLAMLAYTGHRDSVEHGRGGNRPRQAGSQGGEPGGARRAWRVPGDLDDRAVGAARNGGTGASAPIPDLARRRRSRWLPERPGARDRLAPGAARHRAHGRPVLRGPARRHDPVHRHQRGHDRDLAPVVVTIRTSPAARDLLAAARALSHALVHDRVLLGTCRHSRAVREYKRTGQPLLVRRAALLHGRAHLGDRACASRSPTGRDPTGCRGTCAFAAPRSRSQP